MNSQLWIFKNTNLKSKLVSLIVLLFFLFLNMAYTQSTYIPKHSKLPVIENLSEKQKLEHEQYLNSLSDKARKSILEVENKSKLKSSNSEWYGSQVVNPFIRPNYRNAGEEHTDYRGSCDANKDKKVDKLDVDAINSGVENYEAQILGNESVSSEDADVLNAFLNGEIPHIQGVHWKKSFPQEKKEWFYKMEFLNKTEDVPPIELCGYYSWNFVYDLAGVEKKEELNHELEDIINIENNALDNLPVYEAHVRMKTAEGTTAHTLNAIFIGTDDPETNTPTNFYAWEFYDNTWKKKNVSPGDFNMDGDSYVNIERLCYNDYSGELGHGVMPTIRFDLENGIPVAITFKHPDLVEKPDNEPPVYDPETETWSDESSFEVLETIVSTRGDNIENCDHWKYENIKTQTATDVYRNSAVFEETEFIDLSAKPEITSFPNDTSYFGKGEALSSPDILNSWPKYSHQNGAPVNISYRDVKSEEESNATQDVWYRHFEGTDPCGETSGERARKFTLLSGIGINNINQNKHLKIYPNPTSDFITIEIDQNLFLSAPNAFKICINDINGMLLKNIIPKSSSYSIQIKNLSVGVLIVQVYQDGELLAIQKIIKK